MAAQRIFLSCLQALRAHRIPACAFWREYFVRGAGEAGFTIVEAHDVDWAEGLVDRDPTRLAAWRARTWTKALDVIRREHAREPIRYFLGYLYPQQIDPSAIAAISAMGIPTVNFFCDNVRQYRVVPDEFQGFDLHWVPEYEALAMYSAAGLPHLHAPMPAWVAPSLRNWDHPETEPPTFIGSADDLRKDLLRCALESGADLRVRGVGWGTGDEAREPPRSPNVVRRVGNQVWFVRQHGWGDWFQKVSRVTEPAAPPLPSDRTAGPVSPDEYVRVSQQAVVTLGINRVPTTHRSRSNPLTFSRLRDLEAPMLGACYLTEWTEGLPFLYDLGTEVESYTSADELREKLGALTRDRDRRRQMRRRAQERALTEHSVRRTLARIAQRV